MPLYYFDFRYDQGRAISDQAMWFPDSDAAVREAKEAAAKIKAKLRVPRVTVCIRDQSKTIQREIVVVD
jgi:hypothetical protein